VAALRQAVVDAQQSAVVRVDEMRKLTEKESRSTIESLQARCEELNNAWRTEGDARAQANTARTQLQMELDRVSSELSAVKTELVALRERTRHHETAAFELQSAKQKHQLYEQQLKDKDELIAKISALHESGNRQSHSLDQAIAVHKANFEKADAELKDACREINKGNDIIQTLQSELKQAKSKLKMKSTVIQQQEQIILQKQQQLEEAQRAVSRAQDDCAEWQRKHHTLESTLADARRDLEESAHKLSSNEQVIAFLNKEITESKLTGTSLTTSALGSSLSVGSSALAFRPTIPVSSPTVWF
jgi:spindle assembly abnormal protein 6